MESTNIELHIAEQLRRQRLAKQWSREELAERAEINVYTLKHFERTGQISLPRLLKICEVLGLLPELIRAFKPRARVNVDSWGLPENSIRQRGRKINKAVPVEA